MRSPTILDQLNEALEVKDWSVQELLERSKLDLDRSTLQRKLSGSVPMKVTEAQILATALDATIVWPPKGRAA